MAVPDEDAGLEETFDRTRPAAIRSGLRNAIVLALGSAPLFVVLDWTTYPDRAAGLIGIRLSDAAIQLGLLWLLQRRNGERRACTIGYLGVVSACIAQGLMSRLTGGLASPYAVGTMFVILCTAILVPWPPVWMLLVSMVGTGASVSTTLALVPVDPHLLGSTLAAYAGTTAIAVACATIRERTRRRTLCDGRALAEYARLLEAIGQAQSRFIADADPGVVFADLLQKLLDLTGSAYGFIGEVLRDQEGRPYLQTHAITDISWSEETRRLYEANERTGFRFENLQNLFGAAIRSGAAVIANDAPNDPRRGGLPPGHPSLDAFLGLPLSHGDEMMGVAGVANRAGGYDQALVDRLAPFARTVAGLIWAQRHERERRRAEEAVAEQAEVADALARVGQTLIASLDTPVLLERLCQVTAEVLGCDTSHTLLWLPREDAYAQVAKHRPTPAEGLMADHHVPRESLARLLAEFEHGDLVEVDHERVHAFLRAVGRPAERPPGPRLCLALRRGHDVVGIQVAHRFAPCAPFGLRERRIAEGIARLATMALANARLVEELERASRLKSEFVSTMSHELRTPLHVILGFTEMLRDAPVDGTDRTRFVDTIERAGHELLDLIESTLEVGRIEAGRQELQLEPVPLSPFWHGLEASCAMLPRAPAVNLDWRPGADVTLVTDPHKLAIVIRNLTGNALKFTEHGRVEAHAERCGDAVHFVVRDTGIGIPPEHHKTIFEMFRQADGSDARRYGGTGLGLYIVRRFVDLLGGTVTVDSTPGGGSTFTVTIPLTGPSTATSRAA